MGKRGPKPTPTAKLKLTGSWRADTRGSEPQPPADLPEPMVDLGGLASDYEKWMRLLTRTPGLVTSNDGLAIAVGLMALSEFMRYSKEIEANGCTAVSGKGSEVLAPAVYAQRDAYRRLRDFIADFGLSPASRAELQLPTEDPVGRRDAEMFG